MTDPLLLARRLIVRGIPVFAARPALDDFGQWDPAGGTGHTGYVLPPAWQKTVATESWLDPDAPGFGDKAWREGWALCALMGKGLDLLDVDPRNGGSHSRAELVEQGVWPSVYLAADTPSGGTHEFIASLSVGSRDAVLPGLDVKGGLPDGEGRGFAFIAPTVKLSKTTGELAAYTWTHVDGFPDPGDTSGERMAEIVKQARGGKGKDNRSQIADFLDPFQQTHTGPILAGYRHKQLVSYAGSLRRRNVWPAEAETLMAIRWQDCAQPPEAPTPLPLKEALDKLRDVYARYQPDAVPETSPTDGTDLEEIGRLHGLEVAREVERQRIREDAALELRRQRAAETATADPDLVTLTAFLSTPDEDEEYRIQDLWPIGGRVLFAAQYKAGKTTARDNVVRSLVDSDLFLGRYQIAPPAGRVVIIDNELDERMLRRWLRKQGIRKSDEVGVLSLKGRMSTFDILEPTTRARWADKLRAMSAAVVIFDCLRPALDALGLDEDKHSGRFLVAFDALLYEAGVGEAVVVHHMGHTGERSRGDSRLRDWPDVEWQLLREKTDDGDDGAADARRFFKAYGRDVDQPEGLLSFDPDTKRLTLQGGTRKDTKAAAGIPEVLAYLQDNPGATQRGVEAALTDVIGGAKAARAALQEAVRRGHVDVAEGPRRSHLHFLTQASAPSAPALRPAHSAQSRDECASAPIGAHGALTPSTEVEPPDPHPAHSALPQVDTDDEWGAAWAGEVAQ